MSIFQVRADSQVFRFSQIDYVVDLRRFKALFPKFQDNISAMHRRVHHNVGQHFAEIVHKCRAFAVAISDRYVESLFLKPAKQLLIFFGSAPGKLPAFIDRKLGPEIETG